MCTSTNGKGEEEEEEENIYPSQFRPEDKEKIEDLTCAICMELLKEPMLLNNDPVTACQHYFCRRCILASLQEKKECPTCRRPTTTDQLIPARMLERKLASLQVACVFRKQGCSWKGAMGPSAKDYFTHLGVCDEAPIDCEFKQLSFKGLESKECQEKIIRKHYPAHLEKYSAQHFPLLYKERKVTKRKLEEKEEEISKLRKIIRGPSFYEKRQLVIDSKLCKKDEDIVVSEEFKVGRWFYKMFVKVDDNSIARNFVLTDNPELKTVGWEEGGKRWYLSILPIERISFYGAITECEVVSHELPKEQGEFILGRESTNVQITVRV